MVTAEYDDPHYIGGLADLPSNTGVPIYPPRPANACLTVEHAKLVKPELLLQLTGHGNARCAGTDNDDGVICKGIFLVAIYSSYSLRDHLDEQLGS
jgi:hypothetical protein